MADWLGSRIGRFYCRYVDWGALDQDGASYQFMVGGTVELSSLSATKVSGSIKFDGEAPDPSKLLRIYYEFEDAHGDTESRAVCTMLVEVSSDDRTDSSSRGTAKMESVLKVLQDRQHGSPYVIPAGTNAVAKAVEICGELGLKTNNPSSDYVLSQQKVFPTDEANYLAIVNWLLSVAGYGSASPDAFGAVKMDPYVEPAEMEPSFTFEPGPQSVMLPEITATSDWQSSPNAVRLYHEGEGGAVSAYALNVDERSKSSLPNRGWREKTLMETVTELSGESLEERLVNLVAMCERRLSDNSAEVEHVEISCPYLPIEQGDAVRVSYADVDWKGSVTNYSIDLGDDAGAALSARRFARLELKMESGGSIVWSA